MCLRVPQRRCKHPDSAFETGLRNVEWRRICLLHLTVFRGKSCHQEKRFYIRCLISWWWACGWICAWLNEDAFWIMEELGRLGRKGILARVKESLTYFRGNIDMTEPHKNVILSGRHVNKSVSHDPFSRKTEQSLMTLLNQNPVWRYQEMLKTSTHI